jgi:Positive regulator of sigma E activity
MKQVGCVIETKENMVSVSITRHSACDKCKACGARGPKEQVIWAKNDYDAKIGDQVVVELQTNKFYSAVAIIYLIPLITLIAGVWLGTVFNFGLNPSITGAIAGFVFLAITFVLVARYDKKISKRPEYQPKIAGFSTDMEIGCTSELDS